MLLTRMIKYEGLRHPDIFFYIWLKILLLSCNCNDKRSVLLDTNKYTVFFIQMFVLLIDIKCYLLYGNKGYNIVERNHFNKCF